MDWNHDGKHDWQDDAFYNNVISPDSKKNNSSNAGNRTQYKSTTKSDNKNTTNSYSNTDGGKAWGILLIGLIIYVIIKAIVG